jgi:hypothetical protein
MQPITEREVISIEGTLEHEQVKNALRLYGAVTRMMRGTKLSRQAVINLRDKGRAEKNTVEKVREYLNPKRVKKTGIQAGRKAA